MNDIHLSDRGTHADTTRTQIPRIVRIVTPSTQNEETSSLSTGSVDTEGTLLGKRSGKKKKEA